jgi:hypothetical protein
MSVSVELITKMEENFDDSASEGRFWYQIHGSGALCIWVAKGGEADRIHKAYGPAAWLRVSGDQQKPI